MGNCIEQIFHSKKKNNNSQITDSILDKTLQTQYNTSFDNQFLYFIPFCELEILLNKVITNKQNLRYNYQHLKEKHKQINEYLANLDDEDSELNKRLKMIDKNIKDKNIGYICLEIQQIKFKQKFKEINLSIKTSKQTLLTNSIKKQKKSDFVFKLNQIFQFFTLIQGYLTININDSTLTISLQDFQKQLIILIQTLNLRIQNQLESAGQVSLRIECIKNVQLWKTKTKQLFSIRQKQLSKVIDQYNQSLLNESQKYTQQSHRMIIRSSVSYLSARRISYYDNQFLIG